VGTVTLIAIALALVVAVGIFLSYNRFVSQRQYITTAWANVDTELQRRYDLIPNLVATVKGYAAHEHDTLRAVVEARNLAQGDHGEVEHQAASENVLVGALKHLLAVSEAYPDLKADDNFLHLQRELVATEDRIQAARRFFNNNVRDYNRRVQSIPSMFVARLTGFAEHAYFEVEPAVRSAPAVQLDG
jgi:LemA protein